MIYDLRYRIDAPDNVDQNVIRDRTADFIITKGAAVVARDISQVARNFLVLTVNVTTRAVATQTVQAADAAAAKAQVEGSDPDLAVAEIKQQPG